MNRVRIDLVRIAPSKLIRGQSGLFAAKTSKNAPLSCERVCCLLVLSSVTSTPQWIRQPVAAWGFGAVRELREGEDGTRTLLWDSSL